MDLEKSENGIFWAVSVLQKSEKERAATTNTKDEMKHRVNAQSFQKHPSRSQKEGNTCRGRWSESINGFGI